MGKIKSKLIKKTAKILSKEGIGTESFEKNKLILRDTMPSKKIRNQIAGLLTKIKKIEKQKHEFLTIKKSLCLFGFLDA